MLPPLPAPCCLGPCPRSLACAALVPAAGAQWGAQAGFLGETINPNVLGGALVIPLLLAAGLAVGPRCSRRPWRPVWGLVAAALLSVLLLTECRGAYLGAAVGAVLLVSIRWPRLAWVTAPAALAGGAWLLAGMGPAPVLDAMGGLTPHSGLRGRPAIWQYAWQVAVASPLHGAGLGLFAAVQPYAAGSAPVAHAHNLLLQVAMDLGVLGLAAYAAVLAGVAAMILGLLRRRPPMGRAAIRVGSERQVAPPVRPSPLGEMYRLDEAEVYRRRLHWTLALGAAAGLAAMLVHGLVDAALWGNKLACLPWLLFALVASLDRCAKERR